MVGPNMSYPSLKKIRLHRKPNGKWNLETIHISDTTNLPQKGNRHWTFPLFTSYSADCTSVQTIFAQCTYFLRILGLAIFTSNASSSSPSILLRLDAVGDEWLLLLTTRGRDRGSKGSTTTCSVPRKTQYN